MRSFPFLSLVACGLTAAVLSLVGCQPAAEEPEPAAEEEETAGMDDEAALQALADGYAAGWNAADAAAIANLFATDADFVGADGQTAEGRAGIEAMLAEQLDGMFKGTEMSLTVDSVRFIEAEVAVVDGSFEITGITGPDGEAAEPSQGLYSNVVVKEGGEWKLKSVRAMVPQTAPAEEM